MCGTGFPNGLLFDDFRVILGSNHVIIAIKCKIQAFELYFSLAVVSGSPIN